MRAAVRRPERSLQNARPGGAGSQYTIMSAAEVDMSRNAQPPAYAAAINAPQRSPRFTVAGNNVTQRHNEATHATADSAE